MRTTSQPAAQSAATPTAARALRILYADDMPELRNLMTAVLSRDGHQIETAANGAEALERLKNSAEHFDLLITDHHMPVANGLELVRQTRDLNFPGKIVVFSSEISEEVHDRYRHYGVDVILKKPVYPVSFRAVLEQMFNSVHLEAHPPGR